MIQQDLFDAEEIQIVEQKPTFDKEEYQSIVLKSNVKHDEYTDYIQKKFDLQINDVSKVCIPNKLNIKTLGEWNIGVICGAILKSVNKTYYTKTINPALGLYRDNHPNEWKKTAKYQKGETQEHIYKWSKIGVGTLTRPSFTHKFIGKPIYGYENLLLPIDQIRYNKANENQLNLF